MSEKEQILQPQNKNFKEPKLRFKGFYSSWNSVPFLDLFTNFTTNSLSWDFLNYESGEIKNLHYGLIHSSKYSIFNSCNAPFINNDCVPKKYTLYKINDLILADTSEDKKDVGKSIELKLDEYPIICGLHTMHFREKKDVTIPFFKSYYFSSEIYHRFTYKYSEGVKVFSLKPSLYKYFTFSYPDKDEQQKIVNFLEHIDKKIFIIENKINILKKYKKGIQKTLFSKIDIKEINLLKNIVKFERKSKISAGESIDSGDYILYKSGQKNGKIDYYTNDGIYIIANDGGEASFKITDGKFAYTDHCICFKCNDDCMTIVLFNYLQMMERKINYVGFIGTGLKNIDRQYLNNMKIPVTDFISNASIFSKLDKKIKIELTKLETLKVIKKQLMKDLFL